MPDLISIADDLKNAPDQWLAQQMQQPSGTVPPYLVVAELQRREKLRSGAAKAQAPASSVSADLIRSLYAKVPPTAGLGPPTPPGMPPANLTPGNPGSLGPPSPAPAPGTPPANMRMPGPPRMAVGGMFDDDNGDDSFATQPTAPTAPTDLGSIADEANRKYRLPPGLLRRMIRVESGGRPQAVSPKGAIGPMQLMPGTAKELGVNPYDPVQNIDGGARYIAGLFQRYGGDQRLALAAYNAGPGRVDRAGGVPNIPETQNYVRQLAGPTSTAPPAPLVPAAPAAPPAPRMVAQAAPPVQADDTADADTAPPPVQQKLGPQPIWKPEESEDLKQARATAAQAEKHANDLIGLFKAYDPQTEWTPEAIAGAKDAVKTFLGPEPDNSKWQQSLTMLQQQAERLMHPTFSQQLMRFSLALMASRNPHFGAALGEAGLQTMDQSEKDQQEGRLLYLKAMDIGTKMQDKINDYHEKVGTLAFQMQKAKEAAGTARERTDVAAIRQAQKEADTAAKDVTKLVGQWQKTMGSTYAQEMTAIGILASKGIARDPNLKPTEQVQRDAPEEAGKIVAKPGSGSGDSTTGRTQDLRAVQVLHEDGIEWDQQKYPHASDQVKAQLPGKAGHLTVSEGVFHDEQQKEAQSIYQGLKTGKVLPSQIPIRGGMRTKIERLAVDDGFNLASAAQDEQAVKAFIANQNSDHQLNFRRTLGFVTEQIPLVRQKLEAWMKTGLPSGFSDFNKLALDAAMRSPGEAGRAARELNVVMSELQAELPQVYSGGYAPHTEGEKTAQKIINSSWSGKDIANALGIVETTMNMRKVATDSVLPQGVRGDSPMVQNYIESRRKQVEDQLGKAGAEQPAGTKTAAPAGPKAPARRMMLHNRPIIVRNGKWVYEDTGEEAK